MARSLRGGIPGSRPFARVLNGSLSARAGCPTRGREVSAVMADLEAIARVLRDARSIVVLTGAGISTESGIPDFRGPQGVWTKDPGAERRATLQHYVSSAEARRDAWRSRADSEMLNAEPNAGHRAVAELERRAALHTLVTQNIDGLHQAAGSSAEIIIEIHGTIHEAKCLNCGWRGPMEDTLDRVRVGETDPACLECGGMLKSGTISFGENLIPADLERAQSRPRAPTCSSPSARHSACTPRPRSPRSRPAPARGWSS